MQTDGHQNCAYSSDGFSSVVSIIRKCTTIIFSNNSFRIVILNILITMHCFSRYSFMSITDFFITTTNDAHSKVWFLKQKRLVFETYMDQITKPRIRPLFSIKVEHPENSTFDKMKSEFSKAFFPPSKTDFGSDEKWAIEPYITLRKSVYIKYII